MMGQVAIVTGAARGFGLAISERLMQCGVHVFGWDQEPSPIVGDKRFLGVQRIDITDLDAIQSAVEAALSTAGQIESWLTMRVSTVPRCRSRTIHWKTGRG